MNHIVLVGFMGSGKTKVGKQIAADLKLDFVDVDKAITLKMKMSIAELHQRFGEPYYRALETMFVKGFLEDNSRKVISVGSGLPLQEQNHKYLKELGTIVWIDGTAETFAKRLEKHPLFAGEDREEKISKLLKQVNPVYERFSDVHVVTGKQPFLSFVEEIEQKIAAYEKNS